MLYVGHFSFDTDVDETTFGNFTCVTESADQVAAIKSFLKLIADAHDKGHFFRSKTSVFLDAIIGVDEADQNGVITFFEEFVDNEHVSVIAALPFPRVTNSVCYTWDEKNEYKLSKKANRREPILIL